MAETLTAERFLSFETSERRYKKRQAVLWIPALFAAGSFCVGGAEVVGLLDFGPQRLWGSLFVTFGIATAVWSLTNPQPKCPSCNRSAYAEPRQYCPLCGSEGKIERHLLASDRCLACMQSLTRQKSEPAYRVIFCTHCGEKLR